MKFAFVNIITEHVVNQFEFVNKISDYLEIELMNRNYGRGLTKAIFGIGCSGPLLKAVFFFLLQAFALPIAIDMLLIQNQKKCLN